MSTIPQRLMGDVAVSAVGMGAMTLTQVEDWNLEQARRTVHAALDAGVSYFDTADTYGPPGQPGVNETVLRQCLDDYAGSLDHVLVGTKGGHLRYGPRDSWWLDGSPEHLRSACIASLERLGLDSLPFYQWHRPDPQIPFAESLGGLAALHTEGLVQRLGVSNVSLDQLAMAISVLGDRLVAVQNPLSPDIADYGSRRIVDLAQRSGLAFLAYSPFGGRLRAKGMPSEQAVLSEIAAKHEVSFYQLTLAWLLGMSPVVIPIPGASRPESILDNIAAASLRLSDEEHRAIHRALTSTNRGGEDS